MMERLTEKYEDEDGKKRYIHKIGECSLVDCYNKLGGLENIEDELGVSLEVLFKALKDGVYIKDNRYNYPLDVELRHDYMREKFWLEITDDRYRGYLYTNSEDYGVTWALTREELMKNEEKLQS